MVNRFPEPFHQFPGNMALGAIAAGEGIEIGEQIAERQAAVQARELRSVGVNWDLAPVVDVNNNPDNPIIGVRSYGEDPDVVGRLGAAAIAGLQNDGVLACAKHFPGHGDTTADSHLSLPTFRGVSERLNSVELAPFRAAIAAGVGSIMTAHIALPQIDPAPAAPLRSPTNGDSASVTLPATLSHRILTDLLRNELMFKGLVVTDAMEMAGVAARYTAGASAVLAVKAGADMILKTPDTDGVLRAIKQAVEVGHLRADTDPMQLVFVLQAFVLSVHFNTRLMHNKDSITRARAGFTQLVNAYRAPAQSPIRLAPRNRNV